MHEIGDAGDDGESFPPEGRIGSQQVHQRIGTGARDHRGGKADRRGERNEHQPAKRGLFDAADDERSDERARRATGEEGVGSQGRTEQTQGPGGGDGRGASEECRGESGGDLGDLARGTPAGEERRHRTPAERLAQEP